MSTIAAPRLEAALAGLLDASIVPGASHVGVDAVDIRTFSRQLDAGAPTLAGRWFTDGELRFASADRDRLAATLAGKEAVAKVLGTGFRGPIRWKTIEIPRRPDGGPFVLLHAGARDRAQSLGIAEVGVSLCHESTMALAVAIGIPTQSAP